MANLAELAADVRNDGYSQVNAEAKVCQDIVLKAIAESSLSRNVTIKGGVVMRSITGDARRATQDMDLDFIRYSHSLKRSDKILTSTKCESSCNKSTLSCIYGQKGSGGDAVS